MSPFAPFIKQTRDNVEDLTYDNFVYDKNMEYCTTPSATFFVSEEHRIIPLIGGVVEEVELLTTEPSSCQ